MNARYYNGKIGRFVSQDSAYLSVGDYNQLKQITGLKLEQYLSDPQGFNSYAYARNNPLIYIDEDGRFFGQFGIDMSNNQRGVANSFRGFANFADQYGPLTKGVSFVSNTIGDVANTTANIWDPRESAGSRMFAVGMATLDVGSGGKGKAAEKVATGLRFGEKIPSLGKVIENASGKITGFNHDGTYHGLDQIVNRGVNPKMLADTVKNPIARFAGRFDRTGYLSKDAYVVLDKTGQVVTSWTKNEFGSTIKQVLNKIK